jgi:hypothetical protein
MRQPTFTFSSHGAVQRSQYLHGGLLASGVGGKKATSPADIAAESARVMLQTQYLGKVLDALSGLWYAPCHSFSQITYSQRFRTLYGLAFLSKKALARKRGRGQMPRSTDAGPRTGISRSPAEGTQPWFLRPTSLRLPLFASPLAYVRPAHGSAQRRGTRACLVRGPSLRHIPAFPGSPREGACHPPSGGNLHPPERRKRCAG